MNGLIVIDGCDGTGKTTLAEIICKACDGHYLHNTYRWPSKMPLYHTASLHYALKLAREKLVVIDRLWMSEAIYASVYRGGSPWPHMGRIIDRIVRRFGGVYVLTQSPAGHKEKFEKLKQERKEMYDNVDNVRIRYDQLFHGGYAGVDSDYVQQLSVYGMQDRTDVLPYRYDIEGEDMSSFIRCLLHTVDRRKATQLPYALDLKHTNFAGHLGDADILFVGDKTNPKMRAIDWPWYDFGNSSEFFASCLHSLAFDETRAVYINANDANGGLYINDCLRVNNKLKVVALGQRAADTLSYYSLSKFKTIYHPSYAKRFNKRSEFVAQLKEVVSA